MTAQSQPESLGKRALHGAFQLGIASYVILAITFRERDRVGAHP